MKGKNSRPRHGARRTVTTRRGEPFRVVTLEGLLDWHQQNVRELQKSWKGEPVKAACWFAAYTSAEDMVDSNTIKDWAEVIQGGLPRLDTEAALATWLGEFVDGCDTEDAAQAELLRLLQLFWLTDRDGSPSVEASEK